MFILCVCLNRSVYPDFVLSIALYFLFNTEHIHTILMLYLIVLLAGCRTLEHFLVILLL